MLNVLETVVRHASDSLDLVEGNGLVESRATVIGGATPTVVTTPGAVASLTQIPDFDLTVQPRDLTVVPRPGRLILWRTLPHELRVVVDGRASDADLARPAEPAFRVAGRLIFPSGRYNPRLFNILAGAAAGHTLQVFHAPAAVFGDGAGLVSTSIRFEDGSPASWAVVTAQVTLPTADPAHTADRTYRGQADRRGELRLALTGLPAPTRAMVEADALDRVLTLTVTADLASSGTEAADPDTFPAVQIRGPSSTGFTANADFTIRPGGLIQIVSQTENHLSIRPTP